MKKIIYTFSIIIFIIIMYGCTTSFPITFHENGGTNVDDMIVQEGEKITLPVPKREGFTFIGWNDGNGNILNNEASFSSSTDLYAEWEINLYTVTFVDDEGNIIDCQKVKYKKNAIAPSIPIKKGFSFVGWDQDLTNITSDMKIKAIFTEMTEGLVFTKNIDSYIVTGYVGTDKKVIIPHHYKGLPVVKIGDKSFYNNNLIEEVIIPESIQTIGQNAFARCSNLETINFPKSLITIEESAFEQAVSLTEIEVFAERIDIRAFYGCSAIENITLHEGLIEIGSVAFVSCSINEIFIPTTVNIIGSGAFNWCRELKEIKTPASNFEKLNNLINNANLIYTNPIVVGVN